MYEYTHLFWKEKDLKSISYWHHIKSDQYQIQDIIDQVMEKLKLFTHKQSLHMQADTNLQKNISMHTHLYRPTSIRSVHSTQRHISSYTWEKQVCTAMCMQNNLHNDKYQVLTYSIDRFIFLTIYGGS